MANYRLGKKPARPGAVRFLLTDYVAAADLPPAPPVFGHQDLVADFGMLGNDKYGDCVFAGADHEHLIWNKEAGVPVAFTERGALQDYSAVTGFDPNDPNTDQGTDMQVAASYRRKTGVIDTIGRRHVVEAYVALPGVSTKGLNTQQFLDSLASAAYLFGAVGIGIEFPDTAMTQFDEGLPWDVVADSRIDGGHYIPIVGRNAAGHFLAITWGKVQEVTPAFLKRYVDEAIVYLSVESLTNNTSLEGFDVTKLRADLAALGGGTGPTPAPAPAPTPAPTPPVPTVPPFPLAAVKDWLAAKHYGKTARAADAIKGWLKAGGR